MQLPLLGAANLTLLDACQRFFKLILSRSNPLPMKPIAPDFIKTILKTPAPDAHKGTLGHALIVAGSYGKMGAAVLASKAALRSGCGLVTACVPFVGYNILQTAAPEVMVITDENTNHLTRINPDFTPDAVGIGPGIGRHPDTGNAFKSFILQNNRPLVVDADAINIVAQEHFIGHLKPNTVLTPHHREFERLAGTWKSPEEKLDLAREMASRHNLIFVLKGAPTTVVTADGIFVNTTGNPALATAGSGDVLTGILTGLLAQGYRPEDAALLGVYLHGHAADIGAAALSAQAFIASDILAYLGPAYLTL